MTRHPGLVAVVLGLLIAVILTGALVVDPHLTERLAREDDVIESLQTAMFVLALGLALRSAWQTWGAGESPVFEVLVGAMLAGLIIGEVDLDRVLVGQKIISTRFLIDADVWVGWRALAAVAVVGPPLALAVYALRRRVELLAAVRQALAEPAGRVFLAGLVIFGLTEVFERQLGRVPGVPRYFLEETLELIAAVCFGVALYVRMAGHGRKPTSARQPPR
jgi:hypothetical protein